MQHAHSKVRILPIATQTFDKVHEMLILHQLKDVRVISAPINVRDVARTLCVRQETLTYLSGGIVKGLASPEAR
jgi:hypothetical protein